MTVKELKEGLEDLDDDYTIHAYEGEGGCWIMVRSAETHVAVDGIVREFHTEPL